MQRKYIIKLLERRQHSPISASPFSSALVSIALQRVHPGLRVAALVCKMKSWIKIGDNHHAMVAPSCPLPPPSPPDPMPPPFPMAPFPPLLAIPISSNQGRPNSPSYLACWPSRSPRRARRSAPSHGRRRREGAEASPVFRFWREGETRGGGS